MSIKKQVRNISIGQFLRKNLLIIIGFAVLSIYATFPLITCLHSAFYGTFTDPLAWIWKFWWLKVSWMKGVAFSDMQIIAYPFGVHLPELYPVWNCLSRILVFCVGEVAAYNLQILLSFFLSGLAMYGLVYYFTKNRIVAFFSGIVLMFSPYHFARSWDHLCLSNMHWMMIYIISLFNFYKKRNYKSVFICGICFALIGQFSNYYYVYYSALFTILFFCFSYGYAVFRKQKICLEKIFRLVKLSITGLIAAALIMLPQIWSHLKMVIFCSTQAQGKGLIRSFGQLFADSARPLNYFLPTEYHPVLGGFTSFLIDTPLYGENNGAEQSLYLGIIPLLLAFIGYKRWRRGKTEEISGFRMDFLMRFWILALFAFMICSFSPYWGNINGFFIPFPSYFLYKIFPMFRNYARMGGLVMICLCVLSGFGLKSILDRFNTKKQKIVIVSLLCFGVFFEFFNFPPSRITDITKVEKVYLWLKKQPNDIVIAEYPVDVDVRPYLFNQRVHQKAMINGSAAGTYAFEVREKIIDVEAEKTAGILKFSSSVYY